MQLYGTLPSHFTRKVRVLLQELGLKYELIKFENLMEVGVEKYANNPLHLFPVLVDGNMRLFDSDAICDYLINQHGGTKGWASFFPSAENLIHDRQRLIVMNGGMSAGVTLMRSKRSGIDDVTKHAYLRQEKEAIGGALRWLEKDLGPKLSYYPNRFTMLDITLQCFADWARFRELYSDWASLPNLSRFVEFHEARPSFKATHPSLTEVAQ